MTQFKLPPSDKNVAGVRHLEVFVIYELHMSSGILKKLLTIKIPMRSLPHGRQILSRDFFCTYQAGRDQTKKSVITFHPTAAAKRLLSVVSSRIASIEMNWQNLLSAASDFESILKIKGKKYLIALWQRHRRLIN